MLNLIQSLRQALGDQAIAPRFPARVSHAQPDDPFAHPAVGAMSPTELADLPFPRPARDVQTTAGPPGRP